MAEAKRSQAAHASRGPRLIPMSRLVPMIAGGMMTDGQMAAELGVDRMRVWKWRRDPRVVAAVARLESSALEQATHAIVDLQTLATDAMRDLLIDDKTPPAVKLATAVKILEFGGRKTATVVEHTGQIDLSALPEADFRRRAEEIQRELAAELAKPVTGEA